MMIAVIWVGLIVAVSIGVILIAGYASREADKERRWAAALRETLPD